MTVLLVILGICLYAFFVMTVASFVGSKFRWNDEDVVIFGIFFPITVALSLPIYLGRNLGHKLSKIKIEKKE